MNSEERLALAKRRLRRIGQQRTAFRLQRGGASEREIAEVLEVSPSHVRGLLRAAELRGDALTPEELILRAEVDGTPRQELVERLIDLPYTVAEFAPEPFDGSRPGTWNQVVVARLLGFLTDEQYLAVSDGLTGRTIRATSAELEADLDGEPEQASADNPTDPGGPDGPRR